jgi:hypothetical protein
VILTQRVDDDIHEAVDLGLEFELLAARDGLLLILRELARDDVRDGLLHLI